MDFVRLKARTSVTLAQAVLPVLVALRVTLFRIVLVSLHEVVNYDLAGAMLLEGDQHRYIVKRTRPTDRKLIRQVRDLILRNCKELSGNSIRVKDVSTSLRRTTHFLEDVPPLEGEIRSYINVPLVSGNELLGVINVSSLKENAFSQDHLRILYTISNQATAALLRLRTLREEEESRLRSMVAQLSSRTWSCLSRADSCIQIPAACSAQAHRRVCLNSTPTGPSCRSVD